MDASVEMVDCQHLAPGSRIEVETKSRHYRIECLGGNKVRISGHPEYCPEPVPAWLQGSITHDGSIDLGLIERGNRLLFFLGVQRPVTTSRIVSVHVSPPEGAAAPSSQSVH